MRKIIEFNQMEARGNSSVHSFIYRINPGGENGRFNGLNTLACGFVAARRFGRTDGLGRLLRSAATTAGGCLQVQQRQTREDTTADTSGSLFYTHLRLLRLLGLSLRALGSPASPLRLALVAPGGLGRRGLGGSGTFGRGLAAGPLLGHRRFGFVVSGTHFSRV